MKHNDEITDLSRTDQWSVAPVTGRSVRSRRLRLVIVVAGALILGMLGRVLAGGWLEDSFLADALPWLQGTSVTLYFGEPSERYLVPVTRTLSGDQESPDGLVQAYLDGPAEGTDLVTMVPDGTVVRSVSVVDSVLNVDLSAPYLVDSLPLANEAMIQTMMSWPGIDEVRIAVEGSAVNDGESSGHLLYFYDSKRDILVAEPVAQTSPRDVMAAYLAGPSDPDLVGLPNDVRLVSMEAALGSGLLVVDLTYTTSLREFAIDDGLAMRRVIEGMMATMTTGFPSLQFIYVDFEGHGTLGLGQCANLLRRTQPPPEILNDERIMARGSLT